jgi:hypothetical protein
MTNEHIDNYSADAIKGRASEQNGGTEQIIKENIIHAAARRNHRAKLHLAKQLTDQGFSRKSIEKILNIGDSQLT